MAGSEINCAILRAASRAFTRPIRPMLKQLQSRGTLFLLFTLSGLRKEVVTKQDERVPVLGSTPLIGYLFRHEIDVTKSSEIVVLLTPYKVTASSGVLERERQLLEDVEQAQDAPKRTGWDTFVDRVIKNKNVAEQPTVN